MSTFEFHDHEVRTPAGAKHAFEFPIMEILIDDDRCYVTLFAPANQNGLIDNVYCVAVDGSLLWQIEARLPGDNNNTYTGGVIDGGELKFWCYDGFWVTVDRDTGKILDIVFAKM